MAKIHPRNKCLQEELMYAQQQTALCRGCTATCLSYDCQGEESGDMYHMIRDKRQAGDR